MWTPRCLLLRCLLLAMSGLLVACGDTAPPVSKSPLREPGFVGKPSPELGALQVAIIGRPAPDRAVIEATWALGGTAEACELVLVLPVDAVLIEGTDRAPTPRDQAEGVTRWTVGFPTGVTQDAVVRLCGTLPRRDPRRGHRILEGVVRLSKAD